MASASVGRIGIVGAGIAGLTLALCLKQQRREPIILETRSRDALISEGAFLTLAPNAMNGLRKIGLADAILASGINTTGLEILDERGNRLGVAEQKDHASIFGAPSVTIARGALMQMLVAVCENAGIEISYDSGLEALQDLGDRVRVETHHGRRYDVAWLAGCDGLRSRTRSLIFPEFAEPHFTGLVGTGGIARVEGIASTHGTMRMVFGHVGFFGYLKQDDGPVYWFNSYPSEVSDAAHRPPSDIKRLRAMHRRDPAFVDAILAELPELTRDYPIFDMPSLPTWHRGRVVLVGDAAHAVGPHAGQGAAMAIEDAVVLAACTSSETAIATGFERFEGLRRPRVEEVARLTARNSAQKRTTTWFDRLLRRLILPLVLPAGIKSGRALLTYRVDTDPRLTAEVERDGRRARSEVN